MSIFATILVAAVGQNIQLDRPLPPEKAFLWTASSRPDSSLSAGSPSSEGWTEVDWPLANNELPRNQWLALSVNAERTGCLMLTCAGHDALVCNGVEHPRDPGAIGAMQWPAPMQPGTNWIFIKGQGKRLLTSFRPVSADFDAQLHITQYDRTIPQATDLVETDALGAMVVSNLTGEALEGVDLWSRCTFTPNQKYVGRLYPEDWKPGDWTSRESVTIPVTVTF